MYYYMLIVIAVFSGEAASDYEADHTKLVSLPPAQVMIGNGESPAVSISCGLHHTGKILIKTTHLS